MEDEVEEIEDEQGGRGGADEDCEPTERGVFYAFADRALYAVDGYGDEGEEYVKPVVSVHFGFFWRMVSCGEWGQSWGVADNEMKMDALFLIIRRMLCRKVSPQTVV